MVTILPVESLQNWERNPREIDEKDFESLRRFVGKYPDQIILLVDGRDRKTVLGGNMRLRAIKAEGWTEVPCNIVDVKSEEEAVERALLDNSQFGSYVRKELVELIKNFNIDLDLKINTSEIRLGDINLEQKKLKGNIDEVPDVPEAPYVQRGDVIELGEHRVICGDSTDGEVISKLMGDKRATMVFTDPPYNVAYTGGGTIKRKKIENDDMEEKEFQEFLKKSLEAFQNYVDGGIYICMSTKEIGVLKNVFEEIGGHWATTIIWVKNNFTISWADYQHIYEPILYGWFTGRNERYFIDKRGWGDVWEDLSKVSSEYDKEKNETTITFQGFKVKLNGEIKDGQVMRKQQKADIWRVDKPTQSKEHPTMKPVALIQEALRNSSRRNDIVLDTFLGSGSTLVACEENDRTCYGVELDEHYCDVIITRYLKVTGKQDVIINGKRINWNDRGSRT